MSENCSETRPSFPLTPAGRGHRPLFMVLVRLSGGKVGRTQGDCLYTALSREPKMEIPA